MKSVQAIGVTVFLSLTWSMWVFVVDADYIQTDTRHPPDSVEQISKRPFCNAFTGCGRKRSDETPSDAEQLLQKLGQQIMREAQLRELQSHMNSVNSREMLKNHLRNPWFDYIVDNKKRAVPLADLIRNRNENEDNDAAYVP